MRGSPVGPLLALATLTACAPPPANWAVAADATLVHCLNPASGARWDLTIDRVRGLADGRAAHITDREVAWTGADAQTRWALDRTNGSLTMTRPSSTGGYINFDRCASGRLP